MRSEPFVKVNCDGEYYSTSGKLVWRGRCIVKVIRMVVAAACRGLLVNNTV
jgi:hypothetical protein